VTGEIKEFCSTKYDVTFPLFAKIVVEGEGQHPLYTELTREQPVPRTLPNSDSRVQEAGSSAVLM